MREISRDEAVAAFTANIQTDFKTEPVFVACAYWCDEVWPICSGKYKSQVESAAETYMQTWPKKYNSSGNFINGHGCEGYFVSEVPMVTEVKTPPPSPGS